MKERQGKRKLRDRHHIRTYFSRMKIRSNGCTHFSRMRVRGNGLIFRSFLAKLLHKVKLKSIRFKGCWQILGLYKKCYNKHSLYSRFLFIFSFSRISSLWIHLNFNEVKMKISADARETQAVPTQVHTLAFIYGLRRSSLDMGIHPGCPVCSIVAASLVTIETTAVQG